MIKKEILTGIFNNILPATFQNSETYVEQLKVIVEKVNELVDGYNKIVDSGGSGYILPIASSEKLGGIKVGENLTITEDGTLNAQAGGGSTISASVEQTENGATITVTDDSGTTTATVNNGSPGPQGPAGTDGAPGATGPQGPAGTDGFSPTANVQQTETGATITITDKNGTTTATVKNGKDGSGSTLTPSTAHDLGGVIIPYSSYNIEAGNFYVSNILKVNADGSVILGADDSLIVENFTDVMGRVSNRIKVRMATEYDSEPSNPSFGGIYIISGNGLQLSGGELRLMLNSLKGIEIIDNGIGIKIGKGLYFDENGALCASGGGGVVTTGIADEVSTTETQSEGSGITETVQVNDSVNFTKF